MLGLVLTAGGARGAYQAGVLKRLGEVPSLRGLPSPFAVIAGASAGAINGTMLAACGSRFGEATDEIARMWSELRVGHVFRTDALALARTGYGFGRDLAVGGLVGRTRSTGFFDTTPLARLIERSFPPRGIRRMIRSGHLYAVAVSATSYHSGRSFTFVEGRPGHPVWVKSRRLVLPVALNHRHVVASAAIPIVFPPVLVDTDQGALWFGDGGLRLVAPMSPAIRLGSTHVLAVGVRSSRAADALAHEELGAAPALGERGARLSCPPLAQICGVFLNAIFLDHLDADLDHLHRMNELVASAPRGGTGADAGEPMRSVRPAVISPSEDLALVAQRFAHRMPRVVRYLLEALGAPDAQSADLMSYLLFDAAFTRTLIDVGYRDAGARIDEFEELVRSAPAPDPAIGARPRARARRSGGLRIAPGRFSFPSA